jgi:hypothetical protein
MVRRSAVGVAPEANQLWLLFRVWLRSLLNLLLRRLTCARFPPCPTSRDASILPSIAPLSVAPLLHRTSVVLRYLPSPRRVGETRSHNVWRCAAHHRGHPAEGGVACHGWDPLESCYHVCANLLMQLAVQNACLILVRLPLSVEPVDCSC